MRIRVWVKEGKSGKDGGRTLAIFQGGKDLRLSGRTFKKKETTWTKAHGKSRTTHENKYSSVMD